MQLLNILVTYSQNSGQGAVRGYSGTVVAGTTSSALLIPSGCLPSVSVIPGTDGTALLEYTRSPQDSISRDLAYWWPWDQGSNGVVSSATDDSVLSPVTALRCTATTADAIWEVLI